MPHSGFVPLRIFSSYTMLDGAIEPKAIAEDRLEPGEIVVGAVRLILGEPSGDTALAARGQRDQPRRIGLERGEVDMRIQLHRPA
jgi:hypothetical protein